MYSNFQLYPTEQHCCSATMQSGEEQHSNPATFFVPVSTEPSSSSLYSLQISMNMMVPQMTEHTDFQIFSSFDATLGTDSCLSTMNGSSFDTMQHLLPQSMIPLSPLSSSSSSSLSFSSSSSPLMDEFISMDLPSSSSDSFSYLVAPTQISIQAPPNSKKPAQGDFRCKFAGCKMAFGRKYNLTSHEVTHYAVRSFHCTHCSKSFVRRHDWKRHVRIHTGETPHKCLYCDKGFSRADGLQRHYTLNNNDCSLKLLSDPSNPFHRKKRNRTTGFGAKTSH